MTTKCKFLFTIIYLSFITAMLFGCGQSLSLSTDIVGKQEEEVKSEYYIECRTGGSTTHKPLLNGITIDVSLSENTIKRSFEIVDINEDMEVTLLCSDVGFSVPRDDGTLDLDSNYTTFTTEDNYLKLLWQDEVMPYAVDFYIGKYENNSEEPNE